MKKKDKWYVGHNRGTLEAFKASATPTTDSHGHLYAGVVGPFRTKRAALWAEQYGSMNPHFQHVSDAERIAKSI
jgi:hypothetical protein